MSGDYLLDRNLYQAYESLDLLRRALAEVGSGATGDPSYHEPGTGGGAAFDDALGHLDWDKNEITVLAAYVSPDPLAANAGAAARMEDAAEHLDEAWLLTKKSWQGAAAEAARGYMGVVKGNYESFKNELEKMSKDLNAEDVEPEPSSAKQMEKLTGEAKDKASTVARSVEDAASHILYDLYGRQTDPRYIKAQQDVEKAAAEMATYIYGQVKLIPAYVLPQVVLHNAPTVEIHDPRQRAAMGPLDGFELHEAGLVRARTEVAEALSALHLAKEDLERGAAPSKFVFGISLEGISVQNAWVGAVHKRIDDLKTLITQTQGLYGGLGDTLMTYRNAEDKTKEKIEKVLDPEFEKEHYGDYATDKPAPRGIDDRVTWKQIKDLESGKWDGSGVPPEGGDIRDLPDQGEGEGEGEGGDGFGGLGGGDEE